jgi:hypothetical protein
VSDCSDSPRWYFASSARATEAFAKRPRTPQQMPQNNKWLKRKARPLFKMKGYFLALICVLITSFCYANEGARHKNYAQLAKNSNSQNLMDYNNGNLFNRNQLLNIHDPNTLNNLLSCLVQDAESGTLFEDWYVFLVQANESTLQNRLI